MIDKTEIAIDSLDGYSLGATMFFNTMSGAPANPHMAQDKQNGGSHREKSAKALLLVAGATGVPQGFYRRFAEAAVQQELCVLTFDYRGIGRSKHKSLKKFQMDYLDWAQKDLAAVVQYARQFDLPIYIVGHSYGGHAIGLLPDLSQIAGAWTFGTGAGWHGWMPKAEQWRVRFMWNIVAPLITRLYGYLAWSRLGMGEDLPLSVYRQWKRWCSFPNYFFDDPEMTGINKKFDRVTFPLIAVNSTDDDWATPKSRDVFMSNYTRAQLELQTIAPDPSKQKEIGHMGYFKNHCADVWQSLFDWVHSVSPESQVGTVTAG